MCVERCRRTGRRARCSSSSRISASSGQAATPVATPSDDSLAQALGHQQGLHPRGLREQQGEPAPARCATESAGRSSSAVRATAQDLVVRIAVDLQQHERGDGAVAARALDPVLERLVEVAAVVGAGQRVADGLLAALGLDAAAALLGDLAAQGAATTSAWRPQTASSVSTPVAANQASGAARARPSGRPIRTSAGMRPARRRASRPGFRGLEGGRGWRSARPLAGARRRPAPSPGRRTAWRRDGRRRGRRRAGANGDRQQAAGDRLVLGAAPARGQQRREQQGGEVGGEDRRPAEVDRGGDDRQRELEGAEHALRANPGARAAPDAARGPRP